MYLLFIVETPPGSRGRHHFSTELLPVVITETTRAPPDAANVSAPIPSVTCLPAYTYITISFHESAPCDPRERYSNVLTSRVVLRVFFPASESSCQYELLYQG